MAFPVVYTDGLISCDKNDFFGRTPWGVEFGGYLVPFEGFEKELSYDEEDAEEYCKGFQLGGSYCEVPSLEFFESLKKEVFEVNTFIIRLGGVAFKDDWYLAHGYGGMTDFFCFHFNTPIRAVYFPEKKAKMLVRPVIKSLL